jgi:hypothetical protein
LFLALLVSRVLLVLRVLRVLPALNPVLPEIPALLVPKEKLAQKALKVRLVPLALQGLWVHPF